MPGGDLEILLEPRPPLGVERAAGVGVDDEVAGRRRVEGAADDVRLPRPEAVAAAMATDGLGVSPPVVG
jgi:hypothetical protein